MSVCVCLENVAKINDAIVSNNETMCRTRARVRLPRVLFMVSVCVCMRAYIQEWVEVEEVAVYYSQSSQSIRWAKLNRK